MHVRQDKDCINSELTLYRNIVFVLYSFVQVWRLSLLSHPANFYLAAHKACWTVPFARNQRFVGRHSQLNQLENTLFAKNQSLKLAITGLGGVGKTQIVLKLAYRIREKYPECSIFWMPATNTESLQQAYLDVGRQLRIPGLQEEQANVKKLVQHHLSQESTGQWLLIFDNADDIDMWISKGGNENSSYSLKDYLPRSHQGCVILTTRSRKIAVKLEPSIVIKVLEMDEEVATELLSKSLINQELLSNHQEGILKLLQQLTFLPLAIMQAAAYINENGITPSDYLSLLEEQEQDVVDLLSENFEDEGRYQDVKNPVATTWLISFEHIRRLDPLAAEYLSFMSCVDPKDIPQSLLPPAQSRKKETDAIGTLDAYSFVSRRPGDHALDVHRLVHLAMRNWLRREELLTQWAAKAMKRLEEVFPDHDHKNRSVWRAYLAHARYVLESDDKKDGMQERTELLWKFAMCLYCDGRYNEAEKSFSRVMQTRQKVLGLEHSDTLTSMANLALTFRNQGRWKEAEELFVQVIETFKRVLGAELTSINDLASTYRNQGRSKEAEELSVQVIETFKKILDMLTSINDLASTYRNQGRWKEAEELFVQVIETFKKILGVEHPDTLTIIANLASTFWNQGRWKEAEELEVQVMEIRKRVLGAEHPDTLTSMNNLASTYMNRGRWKEAEELFIQVMETFKRVLGAEHPSTLTIIANLASTFRNQGRWKEAEELEVQVIETFKRVLGAEHPSTLTSINNLASTYMNQGRWKEAEELFMQVMGTFKRVLGAEHPSMLTIMANLASTFGNQGRWKEAEELFVQVMETRKRVFGAEHPDTLISMANLALTYRNQERWKEAEELEVQVMETFKRQLRAEHPSTLTTIANLALTFGNQGQWKEAEELEVQVMETFKRTLRAEHPSTLTIMANLASTFGNQRQWKEAEEPEVQVMETFKRVLGAEHPSTLTIMANLASTFGNWGWWKEAEELFVQVMETRKRVFGAEHPDTLTSMANLALTYRNQERWKEAEELEVQVMERSVQGGASRHADQHGQPSVDEQESRAVERAVYASDGDEKEGTWGGASFHADQHKQFQVPRPQ